MSKSVFTSKTFWGVVINIILKVIGLFTAISVDDQSISMASDLMVSLFSFGFSFVFDAIAIYGRIVATKKIKMK